MELSFAPADARRSPRRSRSPARRGRGDRRRRRDRATTGTSATARPRRIDRYDETPESACAFLDRAGPLLGDDPFALEDIEARLRRHPGEMAAKAGARRRAPRPRRQALRASRRGGCSGCAGGRPRRRFTHRHRHRRGHRGARARRRRGRLPPAQDQVGGTDDLPRLETVRRVTDVPLRVDANEGWTLETAARLLPLLERLDVELDRAAVPGRATSTRSPALRRLEQRRSRS